MKGVNVTSHSLVGCSVCDPDYFFFVVIKILKVCKESTRVASASNLSVCNVEVSECVAFLWIFLLSFFCAFFCLCQLFLSCFDVSANISCFPSL